MSFWWRLRDYDSLRSLHKFHRPIGLRLRLDLLGCHLSNPRFSSLRLPNKNTTLSGGVFVWWRLRDSNLWPHACEAFLWLRHKGNALTSTKNPCVARTFYLSCFSDCIFSLKLDLMPDTDNIIAHLLFTKQDVWAFLYNRGTSFNIRQHLCKNNCKNFLQKR